jgi:hypothetical protein
MSRKSQRLPDRFPIGTTYVLESRGSVEGMMLVHRHVHFPDGRQVELAARLVPTCTAQSAGQGNVRPARSRSSRTARATAAATSS